MSKHSPKPNPFSKGPVPPAPKAQAQPKSEEDTPPSGILVKPGTITSAKLPELSEDRDIEGLAKDLASAAAVKAQVKGLLAALDETKALALEQEKEITKLHGIIAGMSVQVGMSDEDVKLLFAMCAEVSFDRTRDGAAFVITLKGRRSHTQGKIGRFPNLAALLTFLRARPKSE